MLERVVELPVVRSVIFSFEGEWKLCFTDGLRCILVVFVKDGRRCIQ